MKKTLRELLVPQAKSKIKAGDGLLEGKYKFFTCSPIQNKFYDQATFTCPSLIFGTGGNASVHYCNEPFSTSTDCLVMYGAGGANLELIYQYLHANLHILQAGFKGAGLQHISKDYILGIEIDLPDEEMQTYITKQIREIDNMIGYRNQQLSKCDDLVKSRFIELFGDLASPCCQWKTRTLIETCVDKDDIKCGPFGTQLSKDEYQNSGVAVWEIPQINNRFTTKPTHYLTQEKAQQLSAYSIIAGDIAMSRKGNVGKCAIFPADFQDGIIHSDVLRIRVDTTKVLPIFMMYQLHYSKAVQHQIELVSSGAIMAGINVTKLKQIIVHIPPIELQNKFATFVEQTDKLKFDNLSWLVKVRRFLYNYRCLGVCL